MVGVDSAMMETPTHGDSTAQTSSKPQPQAMIAVLCATVPGVGLAYLGHQRLGLVAAFACFACGSALPALGYALWAAQLLETARRATAQS